jgi:ATP-dependent RNA helicase SUPV3L1/SUV3
VERETPRGFIAAAGFRVIGPRAIRLDILDRLEQELDAAATSGATAEAATPKLVSLLGCDRATLDKVLESLDWRPVEVASAEVATTVLRHARTQDQTRKALSKQKHRHKPHHREKPLKIDPNSPFASLAALVNKL